MTYLVLFTAFYGFGTWHVSWALAGNSQTTPVFEAKFGWTEDQTIVNNTIISSAGILGLTLGSFLGGYLIRIGRRKGAIVAQAIAILGAAITMIGTVAALTIGRVLVGTTAGCMIIIFGKSVVENMPETLAAKFAMFVNASLCLGYFPCYSMGAMLPDPKDFEANKQDELWRVIFLVPALIGVFEIVLLLLVFKEEPITYCICNDREDEALQHMRRVYRARDPDASTETFD